jgi:Flp pilus assembly pilin Flp
MRMSSRKGQTMVEYIIIVVVIAITLILLFSNLGKAIGKKVTGATAAIDQEVGEAAAATYDTLSANPVRDLNADGTMVGTP